jgi:glutathione reductase (NADPH)
MVKAAQGAPAQGMHMAFDYDLIVIGGGSGGLACAQRAAEFGARALVIESHRLGGTCVNVGCVPKKVMWNAAEIGHAVHDAPDYGFDVALGRLDWGLLRRKRDEYVQRLNAIYERNLGNRRVELLHGRARLVGPRAVQVGDRLLRAERVVLAVGGRPLRPQLPGAELGLISDQFFELPTRPNGVAIVGSGYIAAEFAGIFSALGSHTSVILRHGCMLRHFEPMLGNALMKIMRDEGIELFTDAVPTALARNAAGLLELAVEDGRVLGPFDVLIWAVGRGPNTLDLGLDAVRVATDEAGHVLTDDYQETNLPWLYAIGDCTQRVQLTPVAIAAGRRLADRVWGGQTGRRLDYDNIATVVFSHPPVATVGLTEAEARSRFGDEVRCHTSGFLPMYYCLTARKPRAEMKLVTVGSSERIVGIHVIGDGADEMMQGFAVALRMGATKQDLDDTVAIHPTAAEELVTMR